MRVLVIVCHRLRSRWQESDIDCKKKSISFYLNRCISLPEIFGAAGDLANSNVEGWAKTEGSWAKKEGVWAKNEKVAKNALCQQGSNFAGQFFFNYQDAQF